MHAARTLGSRGARLALSLSLLTTLPMLAVTSLGVGGAVWSGSAAAQASAPDKFIDTLSNDVLTRIKTDKAIQSGDFQRVASFVDAAIMPNVNFERMTALSVGRAWRQASAEQQKQLIVEFRALLLRTYSGALTQVSDKQVKVRPFRGDASADEVIVRSEIVGTRGDPIQLDYRLEKSGNGWKIYDVNVLGIWIVQTYREQFGQEIAAKGIDGLIRSLSEKNRQFDGSAPRS